MLAAIWIKVQKEFKTVLPDEIIKLKSMQVEYSTKNTNEFSILNNILMLFKA